MVNYIYLTLTWKQGKKALSTNVPLKSYKVEIPCDESVNVDFKMSNQVKSHSIQDLKKYILESRDVSPLWIISFFADALVLPKERYWFQLRMQRLPHDVKIVIIGSFKEPKYWHLNLSSFSAKFYL